MPITQSTERPAIAYRTAGTGPPDLLLVHGWAGTGAYFDETLAALDLTRVRATTLDLSGHGESPSASTPWSIDEIDETILTVADAVGVMRPVLLGFSMGGKFVQHLALSYPNRVAGLILVAGTQASAIPLPTELLADWYGRAGSAAAMKEMVTSFLTGPVDGAAFDRWADAAGRIPRADLEGSMEVTCAVDFADELGSLDTPTLVVAGQRDEFFTPQLLEDTIVSQISGARLALIDCGHEIPLERPHELAAVIEAFLAGIR